MVIMFGTRLLWGPRVGAPTVKVLDFGWNRLAKGGARDRNRLDPILLDRFRLTFL